MPSITLTSDSALVDGVPVPVTTGSFKDVLAYLEKQKAKPKAEEPAKVEAEAAPEADPKAEEPAKVEAKAKVEIKK